MNPRKRFLTYKATPDGKVSCERSDYRTSKEDEEAIRKDERSRLARISRAKRYERRSDPVPKIFRMSMLKLLSSGAKINIEVVLNQIFNKSSEILEPLADEMAIDFKMVKIDRAAKKVYFTIDGKQMSRSFGTINNLISKLRNKDFSQLTSDREESPVTVIANEKIEAAENPGNDICGEDLLEIV